MIDQNSRWQIGGPFLTTFLLVSLGLVPNLDRGRFTQNWFWNLFWVLERPAAWNLAGVLERFMVLVPLVLERPGFWDLAGPPCLSLVSMIDQNSR